MAVSKRQVAKLVFSTAVLAAAGAGVYSFTTGGWAVAWSSHAPATQLAAAQREQADPFSLPQSNLDAATAAWAGTAPTIPQSRAVERVGAASADGTPIHEPHITPVDDQVTAESTSDHRQPAVGTRVDRYAIGVPESAADLVAPVTRGQDAADDSDVDRSVDPDEQINPLQGLPPERSPSASSHRAREAFRGAASLSDDDRYGNPTSEPGPIHADAARDQPEVNPFASRPSASSNVPPIAPLEGHDPELERGGPLESQLETSGASLETDRRSTTETPYVGSDADLGSLPPSGLGSYGAAPAGTGKPGERALEGPQKPSLVIQKVAPPEIQVGKPAKFTVQVHNVGGRPADEVIIHDEVPQGTRLVSTSPRAEVDGSHLVWELGTLSAGEQRSVEVQLMPTAEGEIGSVATLSFATPASVKTTCTMPQLAIRMTAPSQVMIGGDQRVKIELHNPGSGDATGVMLFENVPEQVKHAAGPALEFEIGTLRAGETRELELFLTAEKPGHVVNILSARADGNLQVQQQVDFDILAPALEIDVEGPARRYLERPATYQVTIANPGTAPAKDIEIITKLPKGLRFVRANNMGEYDAASHAIYWSLAELPEGERGAVELVAMPIESGQHTLEVEGRAQQGLSDQTRQEILVEGLAAIMFEVTDLEDPIEVGGETTYEIRVVNQGTKAATNVQVEVAVPQGLQVVSASGETRHSIESDGVKFEPLAQLAPKADSVFRLQVQGARPGDQRVTVQVNTDDITQPIRKEESTRVFGDE